MKTNDRQLVLAVQSRRSDGRCLLDIVLPGCIYDAGSTKALLPSGNLAIGTHTCIDLSMTMIRFSY